MIEVAHLESAQLAVATAGQERRAYQGPEVGIARVDESHRLLTGEKANDRSVYVAEGGHAPPGVVRCHLTLAPGMIEAGPKAVKDPVCSRLLAPLGVSVVQLSRPLTTVR